MENPASFWDFSVNTYRQPGVADACLSLQDRFGCDVNVLLYCCWFARTRGVLDESTFSAALSFSQPWADEVVRPLRAARTWMKTTGRLLTEVPTHDCMALRDKIKAAELAAEHLQQNALEELTSAPLTRILDLETQLTNTASNLRRYLEHCNVRLDAPSLRELAQIVTAAIGDLDERIVIENLSATFQQS